MYKRKYIQPDSRIVKLNHEICSDNDFYIPVSGTMDNPSAGDGKETDFEDEDDTDGDIFMKRNVWDDSFNY